VMHAASSPPDTDLFHARMAAYLAVGFVLDLSDLGRQDAPLLDALLFHAVLEANVGRLNRDPELQARHATLDDPPPDELRRPVSINSLALSLGQPFETVRRHVNGLVAQGLCAAAPGGVYVPAAVVASPVFAAAAKARYERTWRLYADLCAVGALEESPFQPRPAEDPEAPVLATGRILSDFYFRSTDILRRLLRDPMTGTMLLHVVKASTEHLPMVQVAAIMREGWLSDRDRLPVSVSHVSRGRGVPYETTRRRLAWLVDEGFCRRVEGGVLPSVGLLSEPALEVMRENLANLRRMFRQLILLA